MIIKNKQKSLTLIELLVVIVIIGIFAGVIMISTSSSIDKANIAKSKVFAENIKNNLLLNLISEWSFEDGAGNIVSDSWGNYNLTKYNDVNWIADKQQCIEGGCIFIGGDSDYALTSVDEGIMRQNNYSGQFTLEIWAQSNYQTGSEKILIGRTGWHGGILASYEDYIFQLVKVGGSPYNVVNVKNTKKWQYLVGTYDNGHMKLYSNGVYVGDSNLVSMHGYDAIIYVGGINNTSYCFNGFLDEAKIYNAALSSSQIKQNYIAGLNSMLSNGNISKQEHNERINTLAKDDY